MVNDSKPPLKTTKPKSKPKKVAVNKDNASAKHRADSKQAQEPNTSSTGTSQTQANTTGAITKPTSSTGWFTLEIQQMMHGFGDYRRPLLESAQLVEEIVHQQMNSLLVQSAEIATSRGARFIGIEDILFLLRKDRIKLARLLRYLERKDLKAALMKSVSTEDDDAPDTAVVAVDQKPMASRPRLTKLCYDFLSSIDQTGELVSVMEEDFVDEVKLERDLRADQMTRCMDKQQYLEYSCARCVSFARKFRSAKFRDWLLKDNLTDIKPNAMALELFHYMSFETVAQIVDLALLVKQDTKGQSGDRLERVIPPNVLSAEYPGIQLLHQNRLSMFSPDTSPQRTTPSPPHSPAVSSNPRASPGPAGSSSSHGKPKPKKRKKVEGRALSDIPTSQWITPSEIREAIQRYWKQGGPYMLFSKNHCSHIRTRLLCT